MLLAPASHRSSRRRSVSPRLFTSQRENDSESALMHYRARSYDPRTGRFIQSEGILSLRMEEHYTYAKLSPLSRIDPRGTTSIKVKLPVSLLDVLDESAVVALAAEAHTQLEALINRMGKAKDTGVFFARTQSVIHKGVRDKSFAIKFADNYGQILRVSTAMVITYVRAQRAKSDGVPVAESQWAAAFAEQAKIDKQALPVFDKIAKVADLYADTHIRFDLKEALLNYGVGSDEDWHRGEININQAMIDAGKSTFGEESTRQMFNAGFDVFKVAAKRNSVREAIKNDPRLIRPKE